MRSPAPLTDPPRNNKKNTVTDVSGATIPIIAW